MKKLTEVVSMSFGSFSGIPFLVVKEFRAMRVIANMLMTKITVIISVGNHESNKSILAIKIARELK